MALIATPASALVTKLISRASSAGVSVRVATLKMFAPCALARCALARNTPDGGVLLR